MTYTTTKQYIRKKIQTMFAGFSLANRHKASLMITERLCEYIDEKLLSTIAVFAPRDDEPDIRPFLHWCRSHKIATAFPVNSPDGPRFSLSSNLLPWSSSCSELVENDLRLDMIIVPGVAFTREGKRLGRGSGRYDRAITFIKQKHPDCLIMGVCFAEQLVDDLPMEEYDQRMDILITDTYSGNVST